MLLQIIYFLGLFSYVLICMFSNTQTGSLATIVFILFCAVVAILEWVKKESERRRWEHLRC
jgi:uncharacterized membrane protein YuzA (DUF378 family)